MCERVGCETVVYERVKRERKEEEEEKEEEERTGVHNRKTGESYTQKTVGFTSPFCDVSHFSQVILRTVAREETHALRRTAVLGEPGHGQLGIPQAHAVHCTCAQRGPGHCGSNGQVPPFTSLCKYKLYK